MPVFRIYLECTSPSHREDGSFATLIGGSASEFTNRLHLQVAMRRAFIAGYGGPHRVLEVLASGLTYTSDSTLATSAPVETGEPAMRERLDGALGAAGPPMTRADWSWLRVTWPRLGQDSPTG